MKVVPIQPAAYFANYTQRPAQGSPALWWVLRGAVLAANRPGNSIHKVPAAR